VVAGGGNGCTPALATAVASTGAADALAAALTSGLAAEAASAGRALALELGWGCSTDVAAGAVRAGAVVVAAVGVVVFCVSALGCIAKYNPANPAAATRPRISTPPLPLGSSDSTFGPVGAAAFVVESTGLAAATAASLDAAFATVVEAAGFAAMSLVFLATSVDALLVDAASASALGSGLALGSTGRTAPRISSVGDGEPTSAPNSESGEGSSTFASPSSSAVWRSNVASGST
jgi:hypothetical protein